MTLPPSPTGEIWLAKIAIEAILAGLLVWRGLSAKYVGLLIYLLVSVAKSLTILYGMQSPGGYYPAWLRMQWISIGAYGILTLESLHLLSRHFRGIGCFAVGLFAAFGTISLMVALTISNVGTQWWSPDVHRLTGWTKYYSSACVVLVGMARAFFWWYRHQVKMASNSLRVASGSMMLMIAAAIGNSIKPWWLSDVFVVGAPLVIFGWLCVSLREEGEDAIIPPPASPENIERWRREDEEAERQAAERLRLRIKLR